MLFRGEEDQRMAFELKLAKIDLKKAKIQKEDNAWTLGKHALTVTGTTLSVCISLAIISNIIPKPRVVEEGEQRRLTRDCLFRQVPDEIDSELVRKYAQADIEREKTYASKTDSRRADTGVKRSIFPFGIKDAIKSRIGKAGAKTTTSTGVNSSNKPPNVRPMDTRSDILAGTHRD